MITRLMKLIYKALASLPSTNTRIAVTLFIALATTARYLASGLPPGPVSPWTPSWEWLIFIAGMSGLDVAQFAFKRNTYSPSPPNPPDIEDKPGLQVKPVTTPGNLVVPPPVILSAPPSQPDD